MTLEKESFYINLSDYINKDNITHIFGSESLKRAKYFINNYIINPITISNTEIKTEIKQVKKSAPKQLKSAVKKSYKQVKTIKVETVKDEIAESNNNQINLTQNYSSQINSSLIGKNSSQNKSQRNNNQSELELNNKKVKPNYVYSDSVLSKVESEAVFNNIQTVNIINSNSMGIDQILDNIIDDRKIKKIDKKKEIVIEDNDFKFANDIYEQKLGFDTNGNLKFTCDSNILSDNKKIIITKTNLNKISNSSYKYDNKPNKYNSIDKSKLNKDTIIQMKNREIIKNY